MNKVATIDLKGKDYALVPERLKAFREKNPRASVSTKPELQADGTIIFTAKILSDKSKPDSAEATGHSFGKNTGDKAFEKLETVAVGRALALLGYLNNGQIATTEEMDEFNEFKEHQHQEAITEAIEVLESSKSLDELKDNFLSLGKLTTDNQIVAVKDELKAKLSEVANANS